jgi:hypothetical protein
MDAEKITDWQTEPFAAGLKIWMSGVFAGPLFFILSKLFSWSDFEIRFDEITILWLAGGFFLFPSLVLLLVFLLYYRRSRPGSAIHLVILTLLTALLAILPFFILEKGNITTPSLVAAYILGLWLGILWAYSPRKSGKPDSKETDILDRNL